MNILGVAFWDNRLSCNALGSLQFSPVQMANGGVGPQLVKD